MLALMELKSGWVTDPNPGEDARSYPMGYKGGGWELLSYQLAWAADQLNRGYYDWRGRGISLISSTATVTAWPLAAAMRPTARTIFGRTRASWRLRKDSQAAASSACGSRFFGGRHFNMLAI